MTDNLNNYLNFGWLIEGQIAGSRGPKEPADLIYLQQQGIEALLRMSEWPRIKTSEIKRRGIEDCHEPTTDLMAPSVEQIDRMNAFIEDCLARGKPVCVSCDGGYGRTSTLLICDLVSKGFNAEEAIKNVKAKRPGSIFQIDQEQAMIEYALRIRHQVPKPI